MAVARLRPVLVTPASAALMTLAEVKTHLRVDHTDDDTYIQTLINAAVSYLDGYTGRLGRAILEQTWRMDFDGFSTQLRLPVGDLMAVSSVTYYDANNAQQTLSANVYQVQTDGLGPYVALKTGQAWPSTYSRLDAVRVTWTAGYGSAAASVPVAIKHAAFLLIGTWYDNRASISTNSGVAEVPFTVEALLAPFSKNQV